MDFYTELLSSVATNILWKGDTFRKLETSEKFTQDIKWTLLILLWIFFIIQFLFWVFDFIMWDFSGILLYWVVLWAWLFFIHRWRKRLKKIRTYSSIEIYLSQKWKLIEKLEEFKINKDDDEKNIGISIEQISDIIENLLEMSRLLRKWNRYFISLKNDEKQFQKKTQSLLWQFYAKENEWILKYSHEFYSTINSWLTLHSTELQSEWKKLQSANNKAVQLASSRLEMHIKNLEKTVQSL